MEHYFAIGKTDDNKIIIFDKFTDDRKAFFMRSEVMMLKYCASSEEEFLKRITL